MPHNIGQDRNQVALLPETLDDFVGPENPVRILDKIVDSFDLKALGFQHAVAAVTGRPAYHPSDLLKLYIYGYLNGVNSGRELQKACEVNVQVMWLLRRVTPNFRTICDFRTVNREAIEKSMRKFNDYWLELGLIGSDLVGIDSSKFKAVNAKDNNYTKNKLDFLSEYYEKRIVTYLEKLQKADEQDDESERKFTKEEIEQIQEKLEKLQKKKTQNDQRLALLEQTNQKQISTTDPESRRMKSGDGTLVGYSAQMTVDSKNNMILDFKITNEGNDSQQFENMAVRAKEILQVDTIKAAADTGYFKAEQIIEAEKAGVESYISAPKPPAKGDGLFQKKDFQYDPQKDLYVCPANEELPYRGILKEHGRKLRYYQILAPNACRECPLREKCTTRKNENRRITRFPDEEILEKALQRNELNPHMRSLRKSMVEHPFGTIKCRINHGRFLTRGIANVRAEFALAVIAYNFKRAISILFNNPLKFRLSAIFDSLKSVLPQLFENTEEFGSQTQPYFAFS